MAKYGKFDPKNKKRTKDKYRSERTKHVAKIGKTDELSGEKPRRKKEEIQSSY